MDGLGILIIIPGLLQYSPALGFTVEHDCSSQGIDQMPSWIPAVAVSFICSGNKISMATANNFKYLDKLHKIDLGDNEFSEFPNFSPIGTLKTLILSKNKLTNESFSNFVIPASLDKLDLHQNQITGLPVLCQYKESLTIDLRFNPIICDENIAWLLTQGFIVMGSCNLPQHLNGREISSLSYDDLEITEGKWRQSTSGNF